MPKSANQKSKLLYLSKILLERTDAQHLLTMKQILEALREYNIEATRKTIYDDMEALRAFGLDVRLRQGGAGGYFVASREFDLPELKLLVDAIQSSRFITHRQSDELISKIEHLTSRPQALQLQRQVYTSGRVKALNDDSYRNIDRIHSAIAAGCKIRYRYFEWQLSTTGVTRIVRHYRHNGEFYCISPWALSWDDENYYMVGFDSEADCIKHYRVDKMDRIQVTQEPREGQAHFERFDMAAYAQKLFGMFSGEEMDVRLRMERRFIGVLRDRFGDNLIVQPDTDTHFLVNVRVVVSPQFFGWLFGLGNAVQVVSPEKVVLQYRERLQAVLGQTSE